MAGHAEPQLALIVPQTDSLASQFLRLPEGFLIGPAPPWLLLTETLMSWGKRELSTLVKFAPCVSKLGTGMARYPDVVSPNPNSGMKLSNPYAPAIAG